MFLENRKEEARELLGQARRVAETYEAKIRSDQIEAMLGELAVSEESRGQSGFEKK